MTLSVRRRGNLMSEDTMVGETATRPSALLRAAEHEGECPAAAALPAHRPRSRSPNQHEFPFGPIDRALSRDRSECPTPRA
jgi:hypothetical protein